MISGDNDAEAELLVLGARDRPSSAFSASSAADPQLPQYLLGSAGDSPLKPLHSAANLSAHNGGGGGGATSVSRPGSSASKSPLPPVSVAGFVSPAAGHQQVDDDGSYGEEHWHDDDDDDEDAAKGAASKYLFSCELSPVCVL